MNMQNKIILIGLFFFFALIMGIYLFPEEEPMVVAGRIRQKGRHNAAALY